MSGKLVLLFLLLAILTQNSSAACLPKEILEQQFILSPLDVATNTETTFCSNIFSQHGMCVNDYSFNLLAENIVSGFIGNPPKSFIY